MQRITKFSDLIFLSIGITASFWSVYWAKICLETMLNEVSAWIGAILVFGICLHYLSHKVVQELMSISTTNYLSPNIIIFICIISLGIYLDFQGTSIYTNTVKVVSVEEVYHSKINGIENRISLLLDQQSKNSDWSVGKRKDWAKHAQLQAIQHELAIARDELDSVKKEADKKIKIAKVQANDEQQKYTGGIVIAYLLLLLSAYGMVYYNRDTNSIKNTIKDVSETPVSPTPKPKKKALVQDDDFANSNQGESNVIDFENHQKSVINQINQPKSENHVINHSSLTVHHIDDIEAEKWIDQYPNTVKELINGLSIRKSCNNANESCTYSKAQRMRKVLLKRLSATISA